MREVRMLSGLTTSETAAQVGPQLVVKSLLQAVVGSFAIQYTRPASHSTEPTPG
jgi:hypothetical protein